MIESNVSYLQSLQVSEETFPDDPMNNGPPYYMQTGMSALRAILTALMARVGYVGGTKPIHSILDFGSGYGRVTRWLRAAFPTASITVNDLDQNAVAFCARTFQAASAENPFTPDHYDLIFLGSVFTHLPPSSVIEMFAKLVSSLRRNGIIVFTTQGRFAALQAQSYPDARVHRAIDRLELTTTIEQFRATGFGFVPNKRTPDYGSAWTNPRWFCDNFGSDPDVIQIMFQEKGWDNFQDVYAYLRAPISEQARSRM